MRIVLIDPATRFAALLPYENLGLAYLAATLRQHGHEVRILSTAHEHLSQRQTVRAVLQMQPALVGITVLGANAKRAISRRMFFEPAVSSTFPPHAAVTPIAAFVRSPNFFAWATAKSGAGAAQKTWLTKSSCWRSNSILTASSSSTTSSFSPTKRATNLPTILAPSWAGAICKSIFRLPAGPIIRFYFGRSVYYLQRAEAESHLFARAKIPHQAKQRLLSLRDRVVNGVWRHAHL